ncbi:hypothetical protein B0H15DRAFT_810370 [Mycena belliarum]|uniref:Uncharacterized protein n=1 Tax=Mycena belliarum TaxID=1033014 RepID=A0AAD6UMA5_9AGAR|nr:hypothetical protein B0H15DRAFT_810370 [Mycena belliae]
MASRISKTTVPPLSPSSLGFRASLARLVSPLRRVRPRVPFFELAIHRTPTIALYRNLLRYAPDDNIRERVQYLFRVQQRITGTEKTRKQLLKGYKWLDAFKKAREGDGKQCAILQRYSRLIAAKMKKEHWKRLARQEAAWQARLRSRPILTGSILKATLFNPPMPRMKPQPAVISRMIATRMKTRDRRYARIERLSADLADLRAEEAFEEHAIQLAGERGFERVFSGEAAPQWRAPVHETMRELHALLDRDVQRMATPPSRELLEMVRAARREKIANKTRERQRERRGEILRCTVRRARKGPPAHVLVRMTPAERRMDRVVRGVVEVGYVGIVKQRMGMKLRDGGKGLARENGTDLEGERLERLRRMERHYWLEGRKRRKRNARMDDIDNQR